MGDRGAGGGREGAGRGQKQEVVSGPSVRTTREKKKSLQTVLSVPEANPVTSRLHLRSLPPTKLCTLPPLAPDNLLSPTAQLQPGPGPSGIEDRSAPRTPTLLPTRLQADRPLTYPACESVPHCSQALEETDRTDVTYSISQPNRVQQGSGDSYEDEDGPAHAASRELTAQRKRKGKGVKPAPK